MYTKLEERSLCRWLRAQTTAVLGNALPRSASKNNNRLWASKAECRRLVIQTRLVFLFSRQKENYNWMQRIQLRLSFTSHFRIHKSHSLWDYLWVLHQWPKRPEQSNPEIFRRDLLLEPRGMSKNCLVHDVSFVQGQLGPSPDRELHQMRLFVQYEAETGNYHRGV